MTAEPREELDRLASLADEAGWSVTDDRDSRRVLWLTRGDAYIHVGTGPRGEVLSLYGGVHGCPNKAWAARRNLHTGKPPDRLAMLERALPKRETDDD